ncbi:hypothetical protein [Methylosarcina fibrata]|uniref:hypothetical protein n=1 Tax=Methylosarcina fibrata TaxID=105972 RepID=UPI00035FE8AC|nr:hypothetical protein [Methylosarcina fibrata]
MDDVTQRGAIMGIGTILKLMVLMIWPVLFLFIAYLLNKEGFKRKYQAIKKEIFK